VREACQLDEEPPRTADDVGLCLMEACTRRRRQELTRRWNDAVGRIGGPPLTPGTSQPEYLLSEHVDGLEAALSWEDGEWRVLRDRLHTAGVRTAEIPTSSELAALADTLRVAALHVREKELVTWSDAVAKYLADGAAQPQASPSGRPSARNLPFARGTSGVVWSMRSDESAAYRGRRPL
jgi:hypothetical protein